MLWALSYLESNFALIVVVFLAVVALGALAFFAKNWKAVIAALVVLGLGFAYMQIDNNAYQRRVAEEAAAQVNNLKNQIRQMNQNSEADAKRAFEDAARIAELETKANETPVNSGTCLDLDSARRVRNVK